MVSYLETYLQTFQFAKSSHVGWFRRLLFWSQPKTVEVVDFVYTDGVERRSISVASLESPQGMWSTINKEWSERVRACVDGLDNSESVLAEVIHPINDRLVRYVLLKLSPDEFGKYKIVYSVFRTWYVHTLYIREGSFAYRASLATYWSQPFDNEVISVVFKCNSSGPDTCKAHVVRSEVVCISISLTPCRT